MRALSTLGIPLIGVLLLLSVDGDAQSASERKIGTLQSGETVIARETHSGWGISVAYAGDASAEQPNPIYLLFADKRNRKRVAESGYQEIELRDKGFLGRAIVEGPGRSRFTITDSWTISGDALSLMRSVLVTGNSESEFLTAITLRQIQITAPAEIRYFAPGLIYGTAENLTPAAIGGADTFRSSGEHVIQIREDRMPAPEFGVWYPDGTGLAVLDAAPNGSTTREDSHDTAVRALTDDRFRFGALGVHIEKDGNQVGYWFPGSEGEVTYRGNTYPGGQIYAWRERYHPIRDGASQNYSVLFRFTRGDTFPRFMRNTWRWAYARFDPPVIHQNLAVLQRSMIDVLASQVQVAHNQALIPNFVPAAPSDHHAPLPYACMGFTGKQLETAELLLADAATDGDARRAGHDRELGLAMMHTFLALKMDPPVGECLRMDS